MIDVAVDVPAQIEAAGESTAAISGAHDGSFNAERHRVGTILSIQRRGDEEHVVDVLSAAIYIQAALRRLPGAIARRIEEVAPLVQNRLDPQRRVGLAPMLLH